MMNLICVGDGDIPVLMEIASREYAGVEQRWFLIESEQRRKSDLKQSELTAQRTRCGRVHSGY
jgi:hypothetical protein